jgi:hypothetical protein
MSMLQTVVSKLDAPIDWAVVRGETVSRSAVCACLLIERGGLAGVPVAQFLAGLSPTKSPTLPRPIPITGGN